MRLTRVLPTLLLTSTLLGLGGCATAGGGQISLPEFEFREVYRLPSGQTLERVAATAVVRGQTLYVILATESGATKLFALMEPTPGFGTTAPIPIDLGVALPDPDAIEVQVGWVGPRFATYVVRVGEALYAGYITILPTSIAQYEVVDPVQIGNYGLLDHWLLITDSQANNAYVGAVGLDDTRSGPEAYFQIQVVELTGFGTGAVAASAPITFGSGTKSGASRLVLPGDGLWDGTIQGGYVRGPGQVTFMLGQEQTSPPSRAPLPLVFGASGTAVDPNVPVYEAARQEGGLFTPPPTAEPCPGVNGVFHRDHWSLAPNGLRTLVVTDANDRFYDCSSGDPVLLNDSHRWLLAAPDGHQITYSQQPLVRFESDAEQVFVFDPTTQVMQVLALEGLTLLEEVTFQAGSPAVVADQLLADGEGSFASLRLIGHIGNTLWIGEHGR